MNVSFVIVGMSDGAVKAGPKIIHEAEGLCSSEEINILQSIFASKYLRKI